MRVLPIKSKRGGLEISINTIVVLILAITMLGLGLYFIKDLFGGTVSQFQEVGSDIEKQMIDQMESSLGRLIMREYRVNMRKGETKRLYFAIRNEVDYVTDFGIEVKCDQAFSGTAIPEEDIRFETVPSARVPKDDVRVFYATVNAVPAAVITTYECHIEVYEGEYGSALYAQNNFFIELQR